MRQMQRLAMEALLSWFEVRLSAEQDRDTTKITAAAMTAIKSESAALPSQNDVASLCAVLASECADADAFLHIAETSPLWSPFELMGTIQQKLWAQDAAVVPYAVRALFVCARFASLMQGTQVIRPELMQGMHSAFGSLLSYFPNNSAALFLITPRDRPEIGRRAGHPLQQFTLADSLARLFRSG